MNGAASIISPGARMNGETGFLQAWGGWLVAVVLGFFGLLPKLRKADLDDNGQAIAAWQQLCNRLSDDNAKLRDDNAQLREDNKALRDRVTELEHEQREQGKRIDGLVRDLAQHSQSAAVLIGRAQ